jgi:hypothetical protein
LSVAQPLASYATILTDFADFPPHFWIEPNQAQHFICGTPRAVAQANAVMSQVACIHETSGMIISPNFYRDSKLGRRAEMQKLGLDPARPTGMVMFGGHGSRSAGIARDRGAQCLDHAPGALQHRMGGG